MSLLTMISDSQIVRRMTDAAFVQYAHRRAAQLDHMNVGAAQEATLFSLIRKARDTRFGIDHQFARIRSIRDFQERVPIRDYDQFWNLYWKAPYPRIEGTTWPDHIPYYALSSGTTTGSTKYLPISREMVASNRKAAITTMALFRHSYPTAKTFTGQFFFLGGSTDLRKQSDGSLAGDLSGIATKEVADFQRPYSFPPLDLSLLTDWETKLARLAEESARLPITAVSGVPSWVLKLFDTLKKITGKSTIAEVWPTLRLIVHGGTKFDPYRSIFEREVGSDKVKYCEVYPCSEGFVATEDPRWPGLLRVVPDHDIFFEFVPVDELEAAKPTRHTLAQAEIGLGWVCLVFCCAGVWSYLVGDTVRFERKHPPLLHFTGRTKFFLSAFGEHLIQEEIDGAVAKAAKTCGVFTTDHHVGPIFPTEPNKPGYHLYWIEFRGGAPRDLGEFTRLLDSELCRLNEDYAAHRVGDLTMLSPVVRVVPEGGFEAWMKSRGKAGGQNKVPRMDNSGKLTQEISKWMEAYKT